MIPIGMYTVTRATTQPSQVSSMDKNPNRVASGLRAAGTDMVDISIEGKTMRVPNPRMVQAQSEQINALRGENRRLTTLVNDHARKLSRMETEINSLRRIITSQERWGG